MGPLMSSLTKSQKLLILNKVKKKSFTLDDILETPSIINDKQLKQTIRKFVISQLIILDGSFKVEFKKLLEKQKDFDMNILFSEIETPINDEDVLYCKQTFNTINSIIEILPKDIEFSYLDEIIKCECSILRFYMFKVALEHPVLFLKNIFKRLKSQYCKHYYLCFISLLRYINKSLLIKASKNLFLFLKKNPTKTGFYYYFFLRKNLKNIIKQENFIEINEMFNNFDEEQKKLLEKFSLDQKLPKNYKETLSMNLFSDYFMN